MGEQEVWAVVRGLMAALGAAVVLEVGMGCAAPTRPQEASPAPVAASGAGRGSDAFAPSLRAEDAIRRDGTNGCDVCGPFWDEHAWLGDCYVSEMCTHSYAAVAAIGTECDGVDVPLVAGCNGGADAVITTSEPADVVGWRCEARWPSAAPLGRDLCVRILCGRAH